MVAFSKMADSDEQIPQTAVAPPVYGDVLQAILSRLPLIHLVPASLVSKSWNDAVSSACRMTKRFSKPWLILHAQSSRPPYPTTAHAYDPASHVWIQIQQPSVGCASAVRSSQPNLLYILSTSELCFSFDPLHLTWHHAVAPRVWRIDPVAAVVGRRFVIAGGACDFEDDPLSVETYDLEMEVWTKSESMPEFFKDCSSSTWLSVASDDRYLFVMEKQSGVTYSLDAEANTWNGPYNLCPDRRVFYSVIGFSDDRLILIGMLGDGDKFEGVKLWEVNRESSKCNEIGEMPDFLVEELTEDEEFQVPSIDVRLTGNMAYIYKPIRGEQVIVCEFNDGGGCRWWSLTNAVAGDRSVMKRLVFTCSKVGMEELQRAATRLS